MIVLFHAASGAAAGALARSRIAALALGPGLHVAADQVPHRHPERTRWEYLAGSVAIGALAKRRGVFDVATLGAFATVLPDLEHIILGPRPGGAKLFHRRRGADRHDATGLSTGTQTLLAVLLLTPLLASARRPTGARSVRAVVARGGRN